MNKIIAVVMKHINIDPDDDENNNGGIDEDDERFLAGP